MTAAYIIKDHIFNVEVEVGNHPEMPWSIVTYKDKTTGQCVSIDSGDFHRMYEAISDEIDKNDDHLKLMEAMTKRSAAGVQ